LEKQNPYHEQLSGIPSRYIEQELIERGNLVLATRIDARLSEIDAKITKLYEAQDKAAQLTTETIQIMLTAMEKIN